MFQIAVIMSGFSFCLGTSSLHSALGGWKTERKPINESVMPTV